MSAPFKGGENGEENVLAKRSVTMRLARKRRGPGSDKYSSSPVWLCVCPLSAVESPNGCAGCESMSRGADECVCNADLAMPSMLIMGDLKGCFSFFAARALWL